MMNKYSKTQTQKRGLHIFKAIKTLPGADGTLFTLHSLQIVHQRPDKVSGQGPVISSHLSLQTQTAEIVSNPIDEQ